MESATSQALGIPEILQHICLFLETDDLVSAIRVCKSWHSSLHSLLFRNLRISYLPKADSNVALVPSINIIKANAHKVRSLTILHRPPNRRHLDCLKCKGFTNLERFIWLGVGCGAFIDQKHWARVLGFLRVNGSTLKEINIEYHNKAELGLFWKILAKHCTLLRHLRIRRFNIDKEDLLYFWAACRNLVSLRMHGVDYYCSSLIPYGEHTIIYVDELQRTLEYERLKVNSGPLKRKATEPLDEPRGNCLLPYLKHLSIVGSVYFGDEITEIMAQSPRLESITGRIPTLHPRTIQSTSADSFIDSLSAGVLWPNLNSLSLPHVYGTDERIEKMLLSLNRHQKHQDHHQSQSHGSKRMLKVLRLPHAMVNKASLRALQLHGHTETLEELNLRTTFLRGKDVLTILATCPCLRTLAVPITHASFIVDDKDRHWVCLKLEQLMMPLELYPDSHLIQPHQTRLHSVGEMQQACIQQLSRLCRLKSLIMTDPPIIWHPKIGLRIKLEEGLEQLAGLNCLEDISIATSSIGEKEVEWMVKHWRRLKTVTLCSKKMKMPRDSLLWWEAWRENFINGK